MELIYQLRNTEVIYNEYGTPHNCINEVVKVVKENNKIKIITDKTIELDVNDFNHLIESCYKYQYRKRRSI